MVEESVFFLLVFTPCFGDAVVALLLFEFVAQYASHFFLPPL
jgi:hypothetical protein